LILFRLGVFVAAPQLFVLPRNTMRVLLTAIEHEPEPGRVRMHVRFGDEAEKVFLGEYNESDGKYRFASMEEELFMRLSELAAKRYCNCTVYQMELMGIIGAFVEGKDIPPLPIELGTTEFGFKRPSAARIAIDRLRRSFLSAWYWWKWRHIHREDIKKYEETGQ
jgi:hypothetical protein